MPRSTLSPFLIGSGLSFLGTGPLLWTVEKLLRAFPKELCHADAKDRGYHEKEIDDPEPSDDRKEGKQDRQDSSSGVKTRMSGPDAPVF